LSAADTPPSTETVEATVTGLNEYGDGVVQERGRVVKVARTVPGDRIVVRVPQDGRRYLYGELVKLARPSAKRVDPRCPAFTEGCGGCQWLQLDYAEQLHWKTRIVRDLLKQRCPVPIKVQDIIPMERPEAYRNKLSLRNEKGRLVFMQDFDGAVVAPEQCRVETLPNQAAWTFLRGLEAPPDLLQLHLRSALDGSVGACIFARQAGQPVRRFAEALLAGPFAGVGAQVRQEWIHLGGREYLEHRVMGMDFRIPLNGFFQTNYVQAEALLGLALSQLGAGPGERVLDLYCGSGFFSLPLARRAREVLGVENNAASVDTARDNARRNGVTNARFEADDVARALEDLRPGDWQAILIDPPRSGCEPAVLEHILRLAPRRLVYVSCSPESLARDLKVLLKAGWRAAFCQPVDMFPHSFHTETVVRLEAPGRQVLDGRPAGR
jgi:23S rRNA (uracil1939-C5)-methyltransferase